VRPAVARLLGSTLGDLLLCEGRALEAAEIFQELWNSTTRRQAYGALAFDLVRSQIEIGQFQRAFDMAEHALQVTEGLPLVSQRKACLAWGVALSMIDPARSISVLEPLVHDFTAPLVADKRLQAGLYLARARLALGDRDGAKRALETIQTNLNGLGERGLHYLVGPESAFREVFSLLRGETAPLELRGLGNLEARLEGQPLPLRKRFAEILVVLALHPEGLNGEQLSIAVYGETADPHSCKADLSKLRGLVPIGQKPYRLGMGLWADFLEFQNLLTMGRLREAMALYRGPLLPGSEAPMIVEHRDLLEESLRQAVLTSSDQEVVLDMAERQRDDLELWEAALNVLTPGDPRWAQVQARAKQLGRNW
jgi:tetratricopeptide (TPR) repeat protein